MSTTSARAKSSWMNDWGMAMGVKSEQQFNHTHQPSGLAD
jgi:hypothetical protein